MAEAVKVPQEEIDKVKTLQREYAQVTAQLGHLQVERLRVERRKEAVEDIQQKLEQEYRDLEKQERELIESFQQTYGDGKLDIESGEFVPDAT